MGATSFAFTSVIFIRKAKELTSGCFILTIIFSDIINFLHFIAFALVNSDRGFAMPFFSYEYLTFHIKIMVVNSEGKYVLKVAF